MSYPAHSVSARLAAWPATAAAHRPVRNWGDDPVLAVFVDPADAVAAAVVDDDVFRALASRVDDRNAQLAAWSVLAAFLVPIAARWDRLGLSACEREDAEADLLAETLSLLRDAPDIGPRRLVDLAHQRAHGRRRTQRARDDRTQTFDPTTSIPTAGRGSSVAGCVSELAGRGAGAATLLVLLAVAVGWTSAEAADIAGCSPSAWRMRRTRVVAALRTGLGEA